MIEIRFRLPDPRRRLTAVRVAHELRDRLPHELTCRGKSWELTAPAPDVARFEYQLELIDAHHRNPNSFDALFLQSGSFFRRTDVPR